MNLSQKKQCFLSLTQNLIHQSSGWKYEHPVMLPALSGGLITGAIGIGTADSFRHKHAQSQYQTELTRKEIKFSGAKRQKPGCEAFMVPVNCVRSTGLQLTAHQSDGASRLLGQPHGQQHCFLVWSLLLGSGGF